MKVIIRNMSERRYKIICQYRSGADGEFSCCKPLYCVKRAAPSSPKCLPTVLHYMRRFIPLSGLLNAFAYLLLWVSERYNPRVNQYLSL